MSNIRSRGKPQSLSISQLGIPAPPASGNVVLYPKTDKFMYQKDDTGQESIIGLSYIQDEGAAAPLGLRTLVSDPISEPAAETVFLRGITRPDLYRTIGFFASGTDIGDLGGGITVALNGTVTSQVEENTTTTAFTRLNAQNQSINTVRIYTGTLYRGDYLPRCYAHIKMGTDVSNSANRFWVVLTNAPGTNWATDINNSTLGFRYRPSVDSGWVGYAKPDSGSPLATTSQIAAVADNGEYIFELQWDYPNNPMLSINGGDVVEFTDGSALPAPTVDMNWLIYAHRADTGLATFALAKAYVMSH